ncbi:dTDP-glucose 4,6-dehydratase [candidate division KSB1 bacterium]|nr:MAG: dTDP-glucose 4,6-dehydratase [candidate division KSB1 bacterium]
MKSILITGGAGFIGSNFTRYIVNKYNEYKVIVLDALTYAGNRENLADLESNPGFSFYEGDIRDKKVVEELVQKVDYVVNFAAETHVDRSIHEAGTFISTDIFGTFTLLEAVKKFNTEKFVQISTDEVYGSIEKGSFSENSPLKPNSPYSASKAGADLLVRSYYVTYGLPVIITRSSNNFGPYQYPEKLIPLFITNAMDNIPLPLYGDGMNVRDWLYVIDNCRAIDLILHNGKFGEVYNVGAGNEETNITITRLILKKLKKPEELIKYVKDRPGHDRRYSLNCEKIRKLGWKPEYDFDEALNITIEWYVRNEDWWRKIKKKEKEYREMMKKFYEDKYF